MQIEAREVCKLTLVMIRCSQRLIAVRNELNRQDTRGWPAKGNGRNLSTEPTPDQLLQQGHITRRGRALEINGETLGHL
jgi:hypothetical protein